MGDFSILAIRIKELRKTMKMTQKEFSVYVGCTAATLSAYENGSKSPSLEIIKGIAEKCNVSIDWLCGLRENKRETLEFTNYKDVALIILKLIEINVMELYEKPVTQFPIPSMMQNKMLCCELRTNIKELNDFFQTYMDLFILECEGKIKQNVIDAWLLTSLDELATMPIEITDDEPPEEESPDATPPQE